MPKKKKIVIGGIIFLLLILLLVFVYFNYKSIQDKKNKEEISEYFNDKTGVAALEDVIYKQEKKDLELSEAMKNKKYTFDDPYIAVDPYEISPLTALIIFQTKSEEEIRVTINDVFMTTMEKSKIHSIPIYGLKAGIENKILLQYEDQAKEIVIDRKDISLINLNVEAENDNVTIDKELYFLSVPDNMNVSAYDGKGNAVWYLKGNYALDVEFLENGRMYLSNGENSGVLESYGGFYEMDYLGKIYKNYSLRNGYHHELISLDDGTTLVLGGKSEIDAPYTASFVYKINGKGEVIDSIDIYDLFHEIDAEFADRLIGTNVLVNSAYYEKDRKELVLSLRGLNSVLSLNFDTKKINWIFGDPEFYSESFEPYLLKITDNSRLPLGAHTAYLTKDGYLGVFNNGYDMVNESSIYLVDHKEDYSSAVLYKIDGKNISTFWEYDAEKKYFNYALGSFQYYDNQFKLINFGWTFKEDAYQPDVRLTNSYKTTYARIMELNGQDEVIFHATYPRGVYRAFKHKLYEERTKNYEITSFELISNHLASNLKEINTKDIYNLLDQAVINTYDFNLTSNSISINASFSNSETVDIYFVSEDRKTYILNYKELNNSPLATINLQLKGNYAVYLKINDQLFDTNKIFSFS